MAVTCIFDFQGPAYGIRNRWSDGDISYIKDSLLANEAGTYNIEDFWTIGDTRRVTYTTTACGSTYSDWVLTDFNNTSSGGTPYNAVIHTKNLFATSQSINPTNTYEGSWRDCNLRNTILASIYNLIPNDFKSLIKLGAHVTGEGSEDIQTTDDYLFCFAEGEVVDTILPYTNPVEFESCHQMEYFKIEANRAKTGGSGTYGSYWTLRSPYIAGNTATFSINKNGACSGSSSANVQRGICAAALI